MLSMQITHRLTRHTWRGLLPASQTTSLIRRNLATQVNDKITNVRSIADLPGLTAEEFMPYLQADSENVHLAFSKAWKDLGQPLVFKMPDLITRKMGLHTVDTGVARHIMTNKIYWNRPPIHFVEYCYRIVTDNKEPYGLINRSPPQWERNRSVANKAILHPKATAQFVKGIDNQARNLVSRLRAKNTNHQVIDMMPELKHYSFSVIMKVAFGQIIDGNFQKGDSQLFNAVTSLLDATKTLAWAPLPYPDNELTRELNRNLIYIRDFAENVLNKHRLRAVSGEDIGYGDFASAAFMSRDDNGEILETAQVMTDSLDLLFGGTETTALSLAYILHNLGRHPDIQQKAYDEVAPLMQSKGDVALTNDEINSLSYINAIVKETLRLTPPAPVNGRISGGEDMIDDIFIPTGMGIMIQTMDIQHSERNYDRPMEFVPERWLNKDVKYDPYAWFPFGAGARGCLGQRLSLIEMKVALAHLIYNFGIKSEKEEELPTTIGFVVAPKVPVNVILEEIN